MKSLHSTLRAHEARAVLQGLGLRNQHQRARLLGVSRRTVERWEAGNLPLPQPQANLVRLAVRGPISHDGAILDLLPSDVSRHCR